MKYVFLCLGCFSALINAQSCPPAGLFYGADSVPNNRFQSELVDADLNLDGYPDIFVPGIRSVYFNDGTGRLSDGVFLPETGGKDPHMADMDLDGDPDLVISDAGGVKLVVNPGDGLLSATTQYTIDGGVSSLGVADLDLDGDPDVVWVNEDSVGILENNGSGVLTPSGDGSDFEFGASDIWIANLDSDPEPELVLTNAALIRIFDQADTNEYVQVQRINTGVAFGAENIRSMVIEDFNGDGYAELAFTILSVVPSNLDFVTVYRNRGDATFVPQDNHRLFNVSWGLCAADADRDGLMDLLVTDQNAHGFWLLSGNGTARFTPSGLIDTFGAAPLDFPRALVCPDLNLDGVPDIVIGNHGNSSVTYAFNRCGSHPCPADFTGEGELNNEDVSAFLDAYFDGNPAADLDQDSRFTHRDVSAYILAFSAGCP